MTDARSGWNFRLEHALDGVLAEDEFHAMTPFAST
jgi:hypothetical protein